MDEIGSEHVYLGGGAEVGLWADLGRGETVVGEPTWLGWPALDRLNQDAVQPYEAKHTRGPLEVAVSGDAPALDREEDDPLADEPGGVRQALPVPRVA